MPDKLTMWHNSSEDNLELKRELEKLGYVVTTILSGSESPVVKQEPNGPFCFGKSSIYTSYLMDAKV